MTTIQDKVTYADGSTAVGKIILTWPPFQFGGVAIAAGQQEYPLAPDGTVTITVYPCVGAQPVGLYFTATYELEKGAVYDEYWLVPDTPKATTIGAIRVQAPATPSVMINAQQLTSAGAQSGMFLGWNGSNWVPMFPSSFNCAVQSFFGRTGDVMPQTGDYTAAMVTGALADPTTTLGDLIVRGAAVVARLGVGTDGQVLTADHTQPLGMRWTIPPGDVLSVFGRTGAVVAQAGDYTAAQITGPQLSDRAVPQSRLINTDGTLATGGDLSADLTLGVVPDTTVQQVQVALAGVVQGTRPELNFVSTPGASFNVTDVPGSNRVDVSVSLTGTGAASPSIFSVNGTQIGTEPELNLIAGTGITLAGAVPTGLNRVDVTIQSTAVGGVSSFNTRTGAVMPANGDYTAAQVTNAVSTQGSYADPAWITSLSASKIVGMPPGYWQGGAGGAIYYNSGNVGIGVSAPQTLLEVAGSQTNSSVKIGGLELESYTQTNVSISSNLYFNGSSWVYRTAGPATLLSFNGGTYAFQVYPSGTAGSAGSYVLGMYIDNTGRVGIGTGSPSYLLSLGPGITARKLAVYDNGSTFYGFGMDGAAIHYEAGGSGGHSFYTNANSTTPVAVISANGYVGIGTASPSAALDVVGTLRTTGLTAPSSGSGLENSYTGGWGYISCYNRGSNVYVPLRINGLPLALNPDSGGTVMINSTSLSANSGALVVHVATNANFWVGSVGGTTIGLQCLNDAYTSANAALNFYGNSIQIFTGNNAGFYQDPFGHVGFGTSTVKGCFNITNYGSGGEGAVPAVGAPSALLNMMAGGNTYGLIMGVLTNGNVYAQVQRTDGNGTLYNLLIQPNGGYTGIGSGLTSYGLWAPLVVSGVATSPSLISQTLTNFSIVANIGTELTVTCPAAAPNPICIQTRHYLANNNVYPLALNPLGGIVQVGNQSSFMATGVFGVYGRTNLVAVGEPYALRLDYNPGGSGIYLGVNSSAQFQICNNGGSNLFVIGIDGQVFAVSYVHCAAGGYYFPDGTLQTTAATGGGIQSIACIGNSGQNGSATLSPGGGFNFYGGTVSQAGGAPGGNAGVTVSYATSDARLKQNIEPLIGGLSVILKMRPIHAEWNGLMGHPKGQPLVSMIAQELEPVCPEAVFTAPMELEPGTPIDLKGLDALALIAHLVLAVQQLQQQVTDMEKKVSPN